MDVFAVKKRMRYGTMKDNEKNGGTLWFNLDYKWSQTSQPKQSTFYQ